MPAFFFHAGLHRIVDTPRAALFDLLEIPRRPDAFPDVDATVLGALKETEQALVLYRAALDTRAQLGDAQAKVHAEFDIAHDQFLAGAISNLDVLTTEQTLIAVDSAVAAADAALVQDQIALFKALGGGWREEGDKNSVQ